MLSHYAFGLCTYECLVTTHLDRTPYEYLRILYLDCVPMNA
jgi:hypothetical protein